MKDDLRFIETVLPKIEGWLLDEAAQLTAGLLRAQSRVYVTGALLEIGVWRGKYLALLYHGSTERVVGIDIFQHGNTEAEIYSAFVDVFGNHDRLVLECADSGTLSPSDLAALAGTAQVRWISVDGSHDADAVCKDLILSESVLAQRGVIAVDDFLNSRAIGVSEGAYRFFLNENASRLVPFAYCANKLFVARADAHEFYRNQTLEFLNSNQELPLSREFFRWKKNGNHWVDFDLLGSKCLVLT
jgi:hypothetical protein